MPPIQPDLIPMKLRSFRSLPRPFVLCLASLLSGGGAGAAILNTNESLLTGSTSVPAFTLPTGANLLNGATATPAPAAHEGTSGSWVTLTNNTLGTAGDKAASCSPNNNTSVVFPLDISVNNKGYTITRFDAYGAWPDTGRDNLNFTLEYSTVNAPGTFLLIATISNSTSAPPGGNGHNSTHTRITEDSTGIIANNVHSIRMSFANQENGWVGLREFIALGTAVPLVDPITWTGNSGSTGNASWVTTADNNWKLTTGGAPAVYNPLAGVTFDTTGINRNISVPTALSAASIAFANSAASNYAFTGDLVTSSNSIVSSGAGSATFANPVKATTGVSLAGAGSLAFNGPLDSVSGLAITGTGSISLNTTNPDLKGNLAVSNGTLNLADDLAAELATLAMSGGTARFTTSFPIIASLSGTGGAIVLGKPVTPVATNLLVGANTPIVTTFAGNISNAAGDVGSFNKVGVSTVTLSGDNTYTGVTAVDSGTLIFGQRTALYHGTTASWTASNILVASGATLGLQVGGTGEFTDADVTALPLGGFDFNSTLRFEASGTFTLSRSISGDLSVLKTGLGNLTLAGASTHTGGTQSVSGVLTAASATGGSLPGATLLGNQSADVFLNMGGDNQFGPGAILTFNNGDTVNNAKFQLRGTHQTVAGLESGPANRISLIQNDEVGTPGYVAPPGPASLTINTPVGTSHTFKGLIRTQDGGTLTVIKDGPGTQVFQSTTVAGYYFNGGLFVNAGEMRLAVTNWDNGANAPDTIAAGATLVLDGGFNHWVPVVGDGKLVKEGTGNTILINNRGLAAANKYTGGTTINAGTLTFYCDRFSAGDGTASGQFCTAGPMDPSNIITVKSGATLAIGAIEGLGRGSMLPQFAPTVRIEPGGKLSGGDGNNAAFIPNLFLDGATVEVTNGDIQANFAGLRYDTNLAFVGTVVVGGVSANPSTVSTREASLASTNANVSLGSTGQPGTVFQVADVTSSAAADLVISSAMKNVGSTTAAPVPSPLTKTGPGTMSLVGAKAYTGATTVTAGVLTLDTPFLADASAVTIAAAGTLDLAFAGVDTVDTLTLAGVQVAAGTYGSLANATPGVIKTARITGSGTLTVTTGPVVSDPYLAWASVIPVEADRDRTDDPDHDGFTNLQEYFFGSSPIAGNGGLVINEKVGSNLIIRWVQRNTGTFVVQESSGLGTWATSSAAVTNAADQSGLYSADYTRKEATIPIGTGAKFARVFATE